jgi:uncharacterized protein (DUF1800 family)
MLRWMDQPVLRAATAAVLCSQLGLPVSTVAQQMSQAPAQDATSMRRPLPISVPEAMELSPDNARLSPGGNVKLTGDAKVLLVLDRFTYGPRPGDLERVQQMGLTQWFRQQLNPNTINDSAMQEKLAQYPAMKLPLDQMMEQFPSNPEIKRAARGGYGDVMAPSGPNRAVFNDRVAEYRDRYKGKSTKTEASSDAPEMSSTKKVNREKEDLPASMDDILAMAPDARFKFICGLDYHQLYNLRREMRSGDADKLTVGFTPQQQETMAAFSGPSEVIASEEVQTKLLRDIYSERQLQEVMVDFWLNHFNVYMKKSNYAPYYIAQFERDVIRPRALGRFEDLLLATAISPAMLDYLDQTESVGPQSPGEHPDFNYHSGLGSSAPPKKAKNTGLNENYAREVMELHTVGVDAGYTQKDVTEMAKVLTGWTVDRGYKSGGEPVQVVFDPRKHEPGTKEVMGQTIHEDGVNEGLKMLRFLAESPQCAHFISQKLAVRFVNDNPPKAMVNRMAGTFLETHGDIRQVLATMVNSPEFFTAATYRNKVKTPQDFVVSAVRATGAEIRSPQALAKTIADLGQPLFGHQTPDGYSMQSSAWNSTTALVSRMNFSMALASDRVQGVEMNPKALLGNQSADLTAQQKQDDIEKRLLHAPVSERTEALIAKETLLPADQQSAQLKQVSSIQGSVRYGKGGKNTKEHDHHGGMDEMAEVDTQAAMATGLVLGSPEFQKR